MTDLLIQVKHGEIQSLLLSAKNKFDRGEMGGSEDYLLALEVINDMRDYLKYNCLQWEAP